MEAAARLIVITGIMASGKSTVAQALAERFPRSAHVRGDQFRRAIVSGRHEMSPDPTPEALGQLQLRYRLAVDVAEAYCTAGFTAVLQDVILGPLLADVTATIRHRPLSLVVLAPDPGEVARREEQRAKTGYGAFTPHDLDRVLRAETPPIGHWLDSTGLTVDETVDRILDQLDGSARLS